MATQPLQPDCRDGCDVLPLEAIKIVLGLQGVLKGKIVKLGGLSVTFKTVSAGRNPSRALCGLRGSPPRG